jgi:hypothetical protein
MGEDLVFSKSGFWAKHWFRVFVVTALVFSLFGLFYYFRDLKLHKFGDWLIFLGAIMAFGSAVITGFLIDADFRGMRHDIRRLDHIAQNSKDGDIVTLTAHVKWMAEINSEIAKDRKNGSIAAIAFFFLAVLYIGVSTAFIGYGARINYLEDELKEKLKSPCSSSQCRSVNNEGIVK